MFSHLSNVTTFLLIIACSKYCVNAASTLSLFFPTFLNLIVPAQCKVFTAKVNSAVIWCFVWCSRLLVEGNYCFGEESNNCDLAAPSRTNEVIRENGQECFTLALNEWKKAWCEIKGRRVQGFWSCGVDMANGFVIGFK